MTSIVLRRGLALQQNHDRSFATKAMSMWRMSAWIITEHSRCRQRKMSAKYGASYKSVTDIIREIEVHFYIRVNNMDSVLIQLAV